MECWGAEGGANPQGGSIGIPGKGGYTSGKISVSSNKILYVFVGSCGQSSTSVQNDAGGYNGGGGGGSNGIGIKNCSGGGGATDIRIVNGSTWQSISSLRSRIMVAAGGAGCGGPFPGDDNHCAGGYAGGLIGGNGTSSSHYTDVISAGATQNSPGNTTGNNYGSAIQNTHTGSFGYANQVGNNSYGGGGGGGWYGGAQGFGNGGSGGSSFISGHSGCNAVNPSTGAHLGVSTTMTINNVNYVFTNTVMKAGNESMPSPTGGTETGHSGNGYCKITWHPAL